MKADHAKFYFVSIELISSTTGTVLHCCFPGGVNNFHAIMFEFFSYKSLKTDNT